MCIKPVEIIDSTFEDFLVVEALLTNESKKHVVNISRTFPLNSEIQIKESNAIVSIEDDTQNIYSFTETSSGKYISDIEFKAEINKTYILQITTSDNKIFKSSPEKITGNAKISEILPVKEPNSLGDEGIKIYVKSESEDENAKYYRYEYEETYKIIAPYWSPFKIDLINTKIDLNNPDAPANPEDIVLEIVPDNESAQVCYNTQNSIRIIQTEVANLTQNKVNFGVKFIPKNDYLIFNRYSILIKQYVQSFNAYRYFQTLNKISSSENVFTQSQPGFLTGNISSINNPNDKIVGYFEVASVSKKRVFLNGKDFFPDRKADYPVDCFLIAPVESRSDGTFPLINLLLGGKFIF